MLWFKSAYSFFCTDKLCPIFFCNLGQYPFPKGVVKPSKSHPCPCRHFSAVFKVFFLENLSALVGILSVNSCKRKIYKRSTVSPKCVCYSPFPDTRRWSDGWCPRPLVNRPHVFIENFEDLRMAAILYHFWDVCSKVSGPSTASKRVPASSVSNVCGSMQRVSSRHSDGIIEPVHACRFRGLV